MTAPRPRTAVIDAAWRSAVAEAIREGDDALTVMCGRDGGPLARTVKCLIDPLVLRLRANPELGQPLLDEETAGRVAELVTRAVPTIADAARWFLELKARRRAAGITDGNIQEQYFPRAYELAVAHGRPGGDAAAVAADTLAQIHGPSSGRSVDDLDAFLDEHLAELDAALHEVWADAPRAGEIDAGAIAEALAGLLGNTTADADRRWAFIAGPSAAPTIGLALFEPGTPIADLLAACGVILDDDQSPPTLSASAPAARPAMRGRDGDAPLDRPISGRVTATLRRTRDREGLPDLADLVDDEIVRSRLPWALHGSVWQAAMLVGVVVAAQLYPLAPRPVPHAFAQALSGRLAAQAHILYHRRFLLAGDSSGDLLVADLREFWRPYVGRLWVRLHGRSVAEPFTPTTAFDAAALLDLLTGIGRSVSYDQRSRIRAAIEKAGR
ncbi:hypothetical protein HUN08_12770 [Gordonia sp. X0973]|uniref:hypothetical protein n=1 Tax=Gordonia sp. X0973 TaxID=2742602 RepID=UPI000F51BA06|nr:hypothetical protein [Gordonia sp. X0973]QKT07962.1 hypothetical protein HUN08_12770 [Gordonia sp. X0973]